MSVLAGLSLVGCAQDPSELESASLVNHNNGGTPITRPSNDCSAVMPGANLPSVTPMTRAFDEESFWYESVDYTPARAATLMVHPFDDPSQLYVYLIDADPVSGNVLRAYGIENTADNRDLAYNAMAADAEWAWREGQSFTINELNSEERTLGQADYAGWLLKTARETFVPGNACARDSSACALLPGETYALPTPESYADLTHGQNPWPGTPGHSVITEVLNVSGMANIVMVEPETGSILHWYPVNSRVPAATRSSILSAIGAMRICRGCDFLGRGGPIILGVGGPVQPIGDGPGVPPQPGGPAGTGWLAKYAITLARTINVPAKCRY